MKTTPILWSLIVLVVAASLAGATSTIYSTATPEQILTLTDMAILATVADSTYRWANLEHHAIVTDYRFAIGDILYNPKGLLGNPSSGDTLTLTFYGGTIGRRGTWISDIPTFAIGESVVLLIQNENIGTMCPLAAVERGLYRIREEGGVPRVFTEGGRPLSRRFFEEIVPDQPTTIRLDQFLEDLRTAIPRAKAIPDLLPKIRNEIPRGAESRAFTGDQIPHGFPYSDRPALRGLIMPPSPPHPPAKRPPSTHDEFVPPFPATYHLEESQSRGALQYIPPEAPVPFNIPESYYGAYPWGYNFEISLGDWNRYATAVFGIGGHENTYGGGNDRYDFAFATPAEVNNMYGTNPSAGWSGVTWPYTIDNQIVEADVILNSELVWTADFMTAYNSSNTNPIYYVRSVAEHELGHVYGRKHSFQESGHITWNSVMNYHSSMATMAEFYAPFMDDAATIRFAYPAQANSFLDLGVHLFHTDGFGPSTSVPIVWTTFPEVVDQHEWFSAQGLSIENVGMLTVTPIVEWWLTPTSHSWDGPLYRIGTTTCDPLEPGYYYVVDNVNLRVPFSVPAGQYYLALSAGTDNYPENNDAWAATPITVRCPDSASASPDLTTPWPGETCVPQLAELDWYDVEGALAYTVRIWPEAGSAQEFETVTSDFGCDQLTPGTRYFWQVKTKDNCGVYGAYGESRDFTTNQGGLSAPGLDSPENGAHCQSVSETVMSWSAVPLATMYQIQIGTAPETGVEIALFNTTTSFSQDLEPGTTYYWHVKTRNLCNTWGEYSPSWSFSTDPEPTPPPDLLTPPIMTGCLGTSGTLTWEDLGVEHGFYSVQIGTSCGTGTHHLAANPHYDYSGLAPGTIYYWRVASPGGTCNVPGTWSSCFFFATAPEVPLPPTLQWPLDTAQCRPMADTLSWAPPAGEGYISGYVVQLGTSCEAGVEDTIAAVPQYSYSELQPNTTYWWRVKTKGPCAYSDYTPCFSFKTMLAVPYLTGPGNGSMCLALADSLTWNAVSGATEYRVQLGTSCGAGTEYDVSSPDYYCTGLAPGTTYFWRVKARDASGCYGSYSDCVSFSTAGSAGLLPPVLQSPPDETKCMQVVPFLSLIWSDVPGAPGYRVQIGTSCGTGAEHDVSSHQYTFTGLTAGTTYYWRVKTRDCYGGYGDYSDCFSFATRPAGALASPDLQSPGDGATCQALRDTLRWTAVPGAGGYLVRFGTSDCPTYGAHHVTAAEYVADDLNPNTIYHWSVATEDSCGTVGSYSVCRWFRTDPQDLAHPTLQNPEDGATGRPQSLWLTWYPVSGATGYKVQLGTSCGTGSVHEVTGPQYAASGLGSMTTYFWRVATKDDCNRYSDYSDCFHFETACDGIVLGPPTLQLPMDEAMCQETSGILDWSDIPGATGYDVRLNATSCGTTFPDFHVTDSQYAYSGLTPGLTYFWQVATKNCASQYGSYSTPCFSFTTRVSAAVVKADGTGSYPTIQAAINAICSGGTIELANGTFTGAGNRDLDFQGKAITVLSQSGIPDSCVIDCQGSSGSPHRGFYFHTSEDSAAVVSGITIQYGYAASPGGGAMLIDGGSSPTIDDCIFSDNASSNWGGAIIVQNGSQPTIQGCAFRENAALNGGAMECYYASPEITDCEFSYNTATTQGGAIYNSHASPTILNSTFIRNTAVYGGGLVDGAGSTPLVSGCTFFDNRASGAGGGIDDFGSGSGANVQKCIIAYGSVGAAVACGSGGAPVLSCCDVFGNVGGDWVGCIAGQEGLRSNFSADPIFCSVDLVDLGLLPESPCAPANNPTCGLVGAKPVGCSAVPDLIVTSIQPDTALVGQSVWVVMHVKNQGGAAAVASKASVWVDEVLKCTEISIPAIGAGETAVRECGVGVLAEGGHLVQVCTDVTELVSELSESNNCKTEPLVVRQQTDVEGSILPAVTGLVSVVPNPFTGATTIHYGMAKAGAVRLEVFDPAGRRVAGLLVGVALQGMQAIDWDGRTDGGTRVASGIYYLRFTAEGQTWTRALVLLR